MDASDLWMTNLLVIIFLALGITILFVSIFGASVLIDLQHPLIGKHTRITIGNTVAMLALVFGALFLATMDIREEIIAADTKAKKIAQLTSEIVELEKERDALKPYVDFFDFVSKENARTAGLRVTNSSVGRRGGINDLERDQFVDEAKLVGVDFVRGSDADAASVVDAAKGYPLEHGELNLYLFDFKRNVYLSELRFRFNKELGLEVEFLITDDFCPAPDLSSSVTEVAGKGGLHHLGSSSGRLEGPVIGEKEY